MEKEIQFAEGKVQFFKYNSGLNIVSDLDFTVCTISFDLLERLREAEKLKEFSQEMQAVIDRYEKIADKSD